MNVKPNPTWVEDEAIWEDAKAAVVPHWNEYDEPWAVVATVYQQMGGRVKGKRVAVQANFGPKGWTPKGRSSGFFRPNGPLIRVDPKGVVPNPPTWTSEDPMQAARLFVGFNVGNKPTYKLEQLVSLVRSVRKKQEAKPDSTFLAQQGIYTGKDGTSVHEDGAQVIILNTDGIPATDFRGQMIELAETIAERFRQEEVILEMQRGGMSELTMGVAPPP